VKPKAKQDLGRPMPKEDLYRGVKIIGLVTFIPFMMAAGPLTGYFTGVFLQEKFNLSSYVVFISVGFGFLVAITEVIKILKAIARANKP
jgi:hypothetical protein